MRTNKRVSAIIIKDSQVLLIHRFKEGKEYWVIPGGGVEEAESIGKALKREVKEETSLDLLSSEYLGFDKKGDSMDYFFSCTLSEGEPLLSGPEVENSTQYNVYILEWVPLSDIPSLKIYPEAAIPYLK